MRTVLFALLTTLLLGTSYAQPAFPDVQPDHWAHDAVMRMTRQGIVLGFPDGSFRGDERLSRYETALIVDRLLVATGRRLEVVRAVDAQRAVLEGDLATLRSVADLLTARVRLLEGGDLAGADGLADRVDALADEVARLREELRAAGLVAPAPAGEGAAGAEGAAGPAGPAGPGSVPVPAADEALGPGADGPVEVGPGADGPVEVGPGASGVVDVGVPGDVAGAEDVLVGDDLPWRVAVAAGYGSEGVPLRAVVGHEDLLGFAGLRVSVDVLVDDGGLDDVGVAGHLTHRFGAGRWSGYAGAGLGYRFGLGEPAPASGPFLGAVLGAELLFAERWGAFLEGTVDFHVAPPEGLAEGAWSPVRTGLVLGASYRF